MVSPIPYIAAICVSRIPGCCRTVRYLVYGGPVPAKREMLGKTSAQIAAQVLRIETDVFDISVIMRICLGNLFAIQYITYITF